jgi:CheY-like chemotaxis protein
LIGQYIRDKRYGEGDRYALPLALRQVSRPPSKRRRRASRLLVVDGDAGNRHVLERLLETAGHGVAAVPTGLAALEQAARHLPDLVISEFRLPDMTAPDLLRHLQAQGCAAPLLLVTGDVSLEAQRSTLGAVSFLSKPYDIDVVLTTVTRLLQATNASLLYERRKPEHNDAQLSQQAALGVRQGRRVPQ